MSKIISVHSFRGGTGKSNTTANLATLLAMQGKRVGVVDTDIQSPGIHILFGLDENQMVHSLNDYLWNECNIEDCAIDVTQNLKADLPGRIMLIPSSMNAGEIARVIREGYDVGLLNDGFQELLARLDLDVLMVDTHPGLNEETLLSIATSDVLLLIMRPDQQDYQGTIVAVDVSRKLNVPEMFIVVNKIPSAFPLEDIKARVESIYHCPVGALLPHADEMMVLASSDIFVLKFPEHPITQSYKQLAALLDV